jgi:hypothetical protein
MYLCEAPSADVLRSVSPPARTAFILEMMLREIYIGLLNSFYHVPDPRPLGLFVCCAVRRLF